MKKSKRPILILVTVLIIALAGYGAFYHLTPPELPIYEKNIDELPNADKSEIIGMLSIQQQDESCAGGCKPELKYRVNELALTNSNEYKSTSTILKSPTMSDDYDELLAKVDGTVEKGAIKDYLGQPLDLMTVTNYEILSKVKYHNFLRDEKMEYTEQKYGCKIYWNATFGWEYTGGQPIIKVRMTSNSKGAFPSSYIELWYNGNTSAFIKEINNLQGSDPCEMPN